MSGEVISDDAESRDYGSLYDCWRYRGYVNFLLGDLGRAKDDGANALKLLCRNRFAPSWLPSSLRSKTVTYIDFRLAGASEVDEQDGQVVSVLSQVMGKVEISDYQGALAIWCDFDASVLGFYNRVYFLQESGILKRMAGDLHGALDDLTRALETDDDNYELLKHRGYVKYLMGDNSGAQKDAERCMAMDPVVDGPLCLGGLPVAFLEFRLKGRKECEEILLSFSHEKLMEKVKEKEFLGALAIWDDFDARVGGYYDDRVFFLQERGILKRMAGGLHGALEDLTAALEISGDDYECLKHRGYVKFLLGDIDGGQKDAKKCLTLGLKEAEYNFLGGFPVAFLEFEL